MADATPKNGLSMLLDTLREEIEGWELAPPDSPLTPEQVINIRYGAYMMALDVLYCESTCPEDGYGFYLNYPIQVKLPREDYDAFRMQLAPYVQWLNTLNLNLRNISTDGSVITFQQGATGELTEVTLTDQPVFSDWLRMLRSPS